MQVLSSRNNSTVQEYPPQVWHSEANSIYGWCCLGTCLCTAYLRLCLSSFRLKCKREKTGPLKVCNVSTGYGIPVRVLCCSACSSHLTLIDLDKRKVGIAPLQSSGWERIIVEKVEKAEDERVVMGNLNRAASNKE